MSSQCDNKAFPIIATMGLMNAIEWMPVRVSGEEVSMINYGNKCIHRIYIYI